MTVVAFTPRPHPTENQPKKDLYEVGEIPPLGHVPKNMTANRSIAASTRISASPRKSSTRARCIR